MTQPLTIEKLVYGGDGLARLDSGQVLFVPQSAPGDVINALPIPKSKPPSAEIREILTSSPERREPPCSVFERCGGCQWQHINDEAQRHWKGVIVEETLARIGKLENLPEMPSLLSPAAWEYRNKIQWMVRDSDPDSPVSKPVLGYFAKRSHDIVAFEKCWIIPEPFNRLSEWIRDNMPSKAGVEQIEVRQNRAGEWLVIFEGKFLLTDLLLALPEPMVEAFPNVVGLVARRPKKTKALWGQDYLEETLGQTRYKVSSESFFQTNHAMLDEMTRVVDGWLPEKTRGLLDLYCGVGTFGLHFANRAEKVMGVESAPSAVTDAEKNTQANQAGNFTIHAGDVRFILKRIEEKYNVTILDPPRAGCHPEVLDWVSDHTTEQIVFISCNPSTLARDLKILVAKGWRIDAIQPMDMFPQTYHIEVMVRLLK